MIRARIAPVLLLIAAQAGAFSQTTPCRTAAVTLAGEEALEMENEFILVRVTPSRYGALSDLTWKATNARTLLPLLDQNVEIIPGTGVYARGDSMPGLRDWLWPGSGHPCGRKFAGTIEQAGGDTAAISVQARAGHWEIKRTLTIRAGSASVEVDAAVTFHGAAAERRTYWSNAMLRMGGDFLSMPGDDNDVLFIPSRKEEANLQGVLPQRLPHDQVVMHVPSLHESSTFYAPAQPWIAAVDKAKRLALGCVLDDPDFPRDTIFYSWTGQQMTVMTHSMEVIHPLREFAPGQTQRFRYRLVVLAGLDDLDYLNADLAISLRDPSAAAMRAEGRLTIAGKAASPSRLAGRELAVWLRGESGRSAEARVKLPPSGPGQPAVFETQLPLTGLKSGTYVLRGRMADMPGEFEFLNYRIAITP